MHTELNVCGNDYGDGPGDVCELAMMTMVIVFL